MVSDSLEQALEPWNDILEMMMSVDWLEHAALDIIL